MLFRSGLVIRETGTERAPLRSSRLRDRAATLVAPGTEDPLSPPPGTGRLDYCTLWWRQATSGQIRFDGQPLGKRKRHEITKLGMARTFQNIRLFKSMTALENVMVGADANSQVGALHALFRTPLYRTTEAESRATALELLDFVGVSGRADELASNLSYGDQRRLEIARAMATKPKLLCLDEPAAGFNPAEKQRLMELIRKVRDQGITVLLIEHDMRLVMGVTDRKIGRAHV